MARDRNRPHGLAHVRKVTNKNLTTQINSDKRVMGFHDVAKEDSCGVAPSHWVIRSRSFEGKCCLHLQGSRGPTGLLLRLLHSLKKNCCIMSTHFKKTRYDHFWAQTWRSNIVIISVNLVTTRSLSVFRKKKKKLKICTNVLYINLQYY